MQQLVAHLSLLPHSSHMEGLVPACEGRIFGIVSLARGVQPARACSRASAQAGPMQPAHFPKQCKLKKGRSV